jgi:RNA recognition motif-containing protein
LYSIREERVKRARAIAERRARMTAATAATRDAEDASAAATTRDDGGGASDDETRSATTTTTMEEAAATTTTTETTEEDGAAAAYAEWYAAAMAAGGVVPATTTPLPVPVVVPYNLVPGTRGDESFVGGMPPPPPMMMYPPPPMMPTGDAAYAQMMAMQRECYATAMYNAQCYGYAAPTYAGDVYYGGGGQSGYASTRCGRRSSRAGRGRGGQFYGGGGGGGGGGYRSGGAPTPPLHHSNHVFGGYRGDRGAQHTVFVKDVATTVSERELADAFAACGRILDCRMCRDANGNKSNYAFVAFDSADAVRRALVFDKMELHGKRVVVRRSDTAVIPVNPLLLPQNDEEIESCARTVYVANVEKTVTSDELKATFEECAGAVNRLHVQVKHNAAANVAFIEFVSLESVEAALQMTGKRLGNLTIRVSASKTPLRVHRRSTSNASSSRDGATNASKRWSTGGDGEGPQTPPTPTVYKVHVNNIPKNSSPGSLRTIFSACGEVKHVELFNNPKSKFPYAFIDFSDEESAERALGMNGREFNEHVLNVEWSRSKKRRPPRPPMDPASREKAERTVYVTDIDPDAGPEDVRQKFEDACGEVTLFWYKAFKKGETQAIAYIEFKTLDSVDEALKLCRTHFLSESRLIKVRHSLTALSAREGGARGSCYTPEVSSPGSLSGDDERTCDTEDVVRDLREPLDAEELKNEVEEKLEKLRVRAPAA